MANYAFAALTEADVARIPKAYRPFVVDGEDGEALQGRFGDDGAFRCVALRGTPLQDASCAIYAQRPFVCRDFKRGCAGCHDAVREWKEFVG